MEQRRPITWSKGRGPTTTQRQ